LNALQSRSGLKEGFQAKREVLIEQPSSSHRVYVVDGFLTDEESDHFVKQSSCGTWEATDNPQTLEYAQRRQGRQQRNDPELARALFHRVKALCPPSIDDMCPVSCSSNIRLYRYKPGDLFGMHYDESNVTPEGTTMLTLLVYLGTGVAGGETIFYASDNVVSTSSKGKGKGKGKGKHKGKRDEPEAIFMVEPKRGRLCLHEHGTRCLLHEAAEVKAGVKYVMRSDVVYG